MRLWRSIGTKLFLGMFASSAGLLLVLSYISTQRITALWTRSFEEDAAKTSAALEHALRYAMLSNRKDDLHAALRDIATAPAVESLRIYDKNGRVMFSTEAEQIGRRVRRDAEACIGCHEGPSVRSGQQGFSRVLRDSGGNELLARIQPIANESRCSSARCHAHSPERTVLGVLDLRMSMSGIRQAQQQATRMVLGAFMLLALASAVVSALFVQRFVRRPVGRLVDGTRRVAAGELGTRISVDEPGELQDLAFAFNGMTEQLQRARERSERWEEELRRAIAEKTESLTRAERQLAQLEKMASLGRLSATVAHELNNPLAGMLVYAKMIERELEAELPAAETRAELVRYANSIGRESARCGEIVRSLLTFSREPAPRLAPAKLSEIVERARMTIAHRLQRAGVEWRTRLASDDDLVCDADMLQQALVALLVNAAEAMPDAGSVEVRSSTDEEQVRIEVADTGVGISAETLPTIFEPFFSTKGEEKGAGLGLAVVYGIVRSHGGTIEVDSTLGAGSVFRISLPRRGPATA